jgi:hypothetical protein
MTLAHGGAESKVGALTSFDLACVAGTRHDGMELARHNLS